MTILGRNCKLYRNTASYATPTWSEQQNCQDVTIKYDSEDVDVTTRGSGGYRQMAQAFKSLEVTFTCLDDMSDADVAALRDAWKNGTTVDYKVTNGTSPPASGESIWYARAEWSVTIEESQSLAGAATLNITLKPGASSNAPDVDTETTP